MSQPVTVGLARRTLTSTGAFIFGTVAAAPAVFFVGALGGIFGRTSVTSLPLLILIIGAVVGLLAVGFTAMSREVPHGAAFYAVLTKGLNRAAGVAGGLGGLVFYNAIQISLYGLLGATLAGIWGGPWWLWALIGVGITAAFGVRKIATNAGLLGTVLFISLVLVVFIVPVAAMLSPASGAGFTDGFSPDGLIPAGLAASGLGGAIALTVAAFIGPDAPTSMSEEAVDEHAVIRGSMTSYIALAVISALAAASLLTMVGTDAIGQAAADPNLPYALLDDRVGAFMTPLLNFILTTSILAAAISFHNVISRYTLAMSREAVLPARLAQMGNKGTAAEAPIGGSVLQTGIAAAVVIISALIGWDPILGLFTFLSTLGAYGLLCLLLAASIAAVRYFASAQAAAAHLTQLAPGTPSAARPSVWVRSVAPWLGLLLGTAVLIVMTVSMGTLVGAGWQLVPVIVVVTVVAGVVWASHLRSSRPEVFATIGEGTPGDYDVPENTGLFGGGR